MVDLIAGNTYDFTIFNDDGVTSCQGFVEMVACELVWLNVKGVPCLAMPLVRVLDAMPVEPTLFDK